MRLLLSSVAIIDNDDADALPRLSAQQNALSSRYLMAVVLLHVIEGDLEAYLPKLCLVLFSSNFIQKQAQVRHLLCLHLLENQQFKM